jgi:hypothetical protein
MKPTLKVNRADFQRALKMLRKFATPHDAEEAVLSYADGSLTISVTGMESGMAAEGDWPGEARMPAKVFLQLSTVLPQGDPLPLSVEDGRLYIGITGFTCTWQEKKWRPLFLPANPTLKQILILRDEAFPAEIDAAGLAGVIADAERQRDSLIYKAAMILKPLGVTEADLAVIVEQSVLR